MANARVHVRNLIANWGGHGAGILVGIFISPFLVHTLGKPTYGIWSLVVVVMGYLGILDLGVRASTGRYVILYTGRGDHEAVNDTLQTSLGLFSVLGLVILAAGTVLGQFFPVLFAEVPQDYHTLVAILLPLWAVNTWLTLFSAVLRSVLPAHDRFDLAQYFGLVVLAIRTGGIVLALVLGYGLLGLTLVYIGCSVIGVAGHWWLARRVFPSLRIWPFRLSRTRLRELFGYGIAASVSKVAGKIIGQTDLLVVGALISVASAATYSVGAMLVYYSWTFLGIIGTTLFPSVQRAAARSDDETVRWYFLRQLRLSLVVGLPIYIGFILFGRPFISLWMEDPTFPAESVAQAVLVMAVLSLSKIVHLGSRGGASLLAAKGHIRFNAIVAAVEAVVNLALSVFFVLVMDWGLAGVAAGTLTSRILVGGWLVPRQALRHGRIRLASYLDVLAKGLIVGATFAAYGLLLRMLFPEPSWPTFWIQVVLALVGYAPLAFFVLVPRTDRIRVLRMLRLAPRETGAEGQGR